jgi:protein gp37
VAEGTAISWATDTFNPWWGCAQVSPACRFCYAKAWDKRYGGKSWGAHGERRLFGDKHWAAPLKWDRQALATGEQRRVFCASMGDVFEDHPQLGEPRQRLWDLIEATPNLRWLLLTKRPENAAGMVPEAWQRNGWPRHIWFGVSAETQRFADQRIPVLVSTRAAVKFVSAAPLLGPLNIRRWVADHDPTSDSYPYVCQAHGMSQCGQLPECNGVGWVITEGESGPKARPSHPDWFRSLRNQCEKAGVAFHHKQNGELTPDTPSIPDASSPSCLALDWDRKPTWWVCKQTGQAVRTEAEVPNTGSWQALWRVGKKAAGRLLDGQLWDEIPRTVEAVAHA